MGGRNAKGVLYPRLTKEESEFVLNTFLLLSQDDDYLYPHDLFNAWTYLADPEFLHHLTTACFRESNFRHIKIRPFAKYFFIAIKGNVAERAYYIATRIFDENATRPQGVSTSKLHSFVRSVVRSYFQILSKSQTQRFHRWMDNGVAIEYTDVERYEQYAIKELVHSKKRSILQIEHWLFQHPMLMQQWREVVVQLYGHMNPCTLPRPMDPLKLPHCCVPDSYGPAATVLSIPMVLFINDALPKENKQYWRPIYNSHLHGTNFEEFVEMINNKGPTVVIVKDESDYIFGGFAPVSWLISRECQGDFREVLFTLRPKMERFLSSGQNNHYQYLNARYRGLPIGMGMGGQVNYWGLWIDGSFKTGHSSVTCSTFMDYTQMSSNSMFQLQHLEVWSVGERIEKSAIN